jgi:hypothetical protein
MDRVSLNRYNLAKNPGKISRIVINGTEVAIKHDLRVDISSPYRTLSAKCL